MIFLYLLILFGFIINSKWIVSISDLKESYHFYSYISLIVLFILFSALM